MLFKCPLCFKRHWTKSSREACHSKHTVESLRLKAGHHGYGHHPAVHTLDQTESQPTPQSDHFSNALGNMAIGYMASDITNALASIEKPAETPAPQVADEKRSWNSEPQDRSFEQATSAVTASENTSTSGYSSLDSFSSLDSNSSSYDSGSSSSDW